MTPRTKGEQRAYLDGYEKCAEYIKPYLSGYGKKKLECLLTAVRNAVEIEDITQSEYEHDHDVVKAYNDGQAYILDKIREEIEKESEVKTLQLHWGEAMGLNKAIDIIDKYRGGE